MPEKRQSERRLHESTIDFSVYVLQFKELVTLSLRAKTVDISETGMGIMVDYHLEPGHVIKFMSDLPYATGVVKWSRMVENEYRVGINFI